MSSGRRRRQGFVAVKTFGCWPGAVGIKFLHDMAAFRAVFDERSWRAEGSAAVLAVGRGPLAGGEERRQEGATFVAAVEGKFWSFGV